MAQYEELPVYKVAYDLLNQILMLCVNMQRTHRYTLGERIINGMIDLLLNIYRANCINDKFGPIRAARENVMTVRLLFRTAFDLKQFGNKQFIALSEQIESISKQLTAWEKYCTEKDNKKNNCPDEAH